MDCTALGRPTLGLALSLSLASCGISTPIRQQHPSVQKATPSIDDSDEARCATARFTASRDLGCEHVEIVLTLERRYANTATARYVVEGCGRRALYAETCEDYPHCRYLMLSLVPLTPPPAPAPPEPSAP